MKTDIQAESMWLRKDKYVEANHTKPEANEIRTKSELGESSLHTTQRTRQPTHYNLLKGFDLLLKIEENISNLKKKNTMHFFYRMDIKPIRKGWAFTLLATFQERNLGTF